MEMMMMIESPMINLYETNAGIKMQSCVVL